MSNLLKFNAIAISLIFISVSFNSVALKPSKTYATSPADYGMTFNSVKFKTSDNLELSGWFYKATDPQSRKVIILSDDGDGNMADLIEIASNFISLGYNVFSYDYRGYGSSAAFEINPNFFIYAQFQKDLEGALAFVMKEYPSLKTIHFWGMGIGAGLAIGVGALKPEVSKIIADSPYLTFDITQKRYEAQGMKVLMPLGFDKTILEPQYALEARAAGLTGILLIAGDADQIFTAADIKELSKYRKSITTTYVVKGATAANTFSTDKAKYFTEVKSFLGL